MKVIRADFKAAGIPLVDERGYRVDFHALRMTYITLAATRGRFASGSDGTGLRNSDIRLTMKNLHGRGCNCLWRQRFGDCPAFGDSQIDSQTLVAGDQFMSPSVIGLKFIKVGKFVGKHW